MIRLLARLCYIRDRLRALWRATELIPWACEHCGGVNETPLILWHTVRVALICRWCRYLQDYPNYIKAIDPYAKEFHR